MRTRNLALIAAAVPLALSLLGCTTDTRRPPGERLHLSKCGACHLRPEPDRYDRDGWRSVLDNHATRVPMSPTERATLLDHLTRTPTRDDPAAEDRR